MTKSLKDISWNVTEEQYRADPAISYSTLARYEREGFNNLAHLYDKVESPSLTFGSIVDCLITGSAEELTERFLIADFPNIPDSQIAVLKDLYKNLGDSYKGLSLEKIPDSSILAAALNCQFQQNWKPETRVKVLRENGSEYWDLLILAEGKTVVSQKVYDDAFACAEALRTSEATKRYFELDNPFDNSVEHLYQLKFRGEYEGIPVRCMMDLVIVDHAAKTIVPVDLKTSFKHEWDFPKSFKEWSYYIQAGLYHYILEQNLRKDEYFRDFKIFPYRFIVISNSSRIPLVWEFDQTTSVADIHLGEETFRNWRNILHELNYYLKYSPQVPVGIDVNGKNKIERYFDVQRY